MEEKKTELDETLDQYRDRLIKTYVEDHVRLLLMYVGNTSWDEDRLREEFEKILPRLTEIKESLWTNLRPHLNIDPAKLDEESGKWWKL